MSWHEALTKKHQVRRSNKYNAKRCELNGISFASLGEREMYGLLQLMERADKQVSNIRCQVSIQITPSVKFKIDFVVFDRELNKDVGVEFKGVDGERWQVIKQLWKDFGPMPMRIYKKQGNRIFLHETIGEGKYGNQF